MVSDVEVLLVSSPESDGESMALTKRSFLSSMASSGSVLRSTSFSGKVSVMMRAVRSEEYLCLVWSGHNTAVTRAPESQSH